MLLLCLNTKQLAPSQGTGKKAAKIKKFVLRFSTKCKGFGKYTSTTYLKKVKWPGKKYNHLPTLLLLMMTRVFG